MPTPPETRPSQEQLWAVANYLACRKALHRIFLSGLALLLVIFGGLVGLHALPGEPLPLFLLGALDLLVVFVALLIAVQSARQTYEVRIARQQALRAGLPVELLKAAEMILRS